MTRADPTRSRRALRALLGSLVCGALAACSSPDAATPMPEPLTLDPEKIGNRTISTPTPFVEGIAADAGAAPPGATVRLTNLDDTGPVVTAVASADGSFRFDLAESVESGDELRLQAELDGRRGPPLDVSTAPAVAPSERHGCVVLRPGYELSFAPASSVLELELENRCAAEASADMPRARLGSPDFAIGSGLPLLVPRNGRGGFEVVFSGALDAESEDVLFVDVTVDGRAIRYPVTLRFPGSEP